MTIHNFQYQSRRFGVSKSDKGGRGGGVGFERFGEGFGEEMGEVGEFGGEVVDQWGVLVVQDG